MKVVKQIWEMLGNNNKQRFTRLMIIIWSSILAFNLSVNLGYDKDRGLYWKPFDIHVNYNKGEK